MTFAKSVEKFSETAASKRDHLSRDPLGFFVLTLMAGAYVGLGILLILSVGQGVSPSIRPIVMGASFGIALLLVIFAGSELFTGHTMYMTMGWLTKRTKLADLLRCWATSWVGNSIGAMCLALLFVYGGGGIVLGGDDSLLLKLAAKKMHASGVHLILNGILCNWLVCLAIWTSSRLENEMARMFITWFCLYAFIAAGFEHSVANMTVFSVALITDHPDTISFVGALRNLAYVSLGNAIAGAGIMGFGYWLAAGRPRVMPILKTQS
ncbi:formate/nitrite transporter family protein [Rhodobacteraceae bacterium]|nr:formate/nitrite transporter family protein [Paracoccaceae bacterium]